MNSDREHASGDPAEQLRRVHHQMPRWVLVLLAAAALIALASRIGTLLLTLLISGVLAYIMSHVVNVAESYGIRRGVAVAALFLAGALAIVGADLLLADDLEREIKNFYDQVPEFNRRLDAVLTPPSSGHPVASSALEDAIKKLLSAAIGPGKLFEKAFNLSGLMNQAAPFLMALVLIPFFSFFLLKDWPRILRSVMAWVPPDYVETTLAAISEVNILVGKYLRGLAIDCLAVGALAAAGLWALGIDYPITLGLLTGAANVIPYFGVIISCSAASAFAFMQFGTLAAVVNILILYVTIRLIDDFVIQPLVVGKSVQLHPMLLVITIIAGESIFGISGMILGVPFVTAALKVFRIFLEHRAVRSARRARAVRPRATAAPLVRPL